MRRFLPTSIAGQAILILIVGLTVSHVLSMLIYAGERIDALTVLGGRDMAQRAANVAHLISDVPKAWRERLVETLDEPNFRVILSPESMLISDGPDEWRVRSIRDYIRTQFHANVARRIVVQMIDTPETRAAHDKDPMAQWMPTHMWHMMYGVSQAQSLRISVQLIDGEWVNFSGAVHGSPPLFSEANLTSTLYMVIGVLVVAALFVARLTKPIRMFAQAATRLGRDVNAPKLTEAGPDEVRDAVRAFNDMQDRLRHLIENRARMLAAISHDLRTPLTLLRLRTEMLDDSEDRNRMLATLDEMEAMIAQTLAFAKEDAHQEKTREVDLAALVEAVCTDLTDVGADIRYEGPESYRYDCRPLAIKRAVTNLIRNAATYAGGARVALDVDKDTVSIAVDDDGPGIPEDMLEQAFAPFFRVEESRSRDTGGVGLGLSVARTIVEGHGGRVVLSNRNEGGLRAKLTLPV